MRIDRPSSGDDPDRPERGDRAERSDRSAQSYRPLLGADGAPLYRHAYRRQVEAELAAELDQRRDSVADGQRDRLPERTRGAPTVGLWRDRAGVEREVRSGTDEWSTSVDEVTAAKEIARAPHRLNIASHVEAKVAAGMRAERLTDEAITINNRPCPDRYGCDEMLPRLLPPGARLTVYGEDGFKKTYIGEEEDR